MKTKLNSAIFMSLFILLPMMMNAQNIKSFVKKYLTELPSIPMNNSLKRYRMTAIYTNRDLYGNFTGKMRVQGDYSKNVGSDSAHWNNVTISSTNDYSASFPAGTKQEYMENLKYIPSSKMLDKNAFSKFPAKTEAVFAKNLVWDMLAIEEFAYKYIDSLKLNKYYIIRPKEGFDMGTVGKYTHDNIQIRWIGISEMNNELCAVIDYRAIDNLLEINMDQVKGKGTEQYWGTTWLSIKTGAIEYADTYSGTIQEIQVKGMTNKFLVKTIREIRVDKIK